MTSPATLEAQRLTKVFETGSNLFGRRLRTVAVDDISFSVAQGETLGIVGESGSGKSTIARLLLRLIEPTSGTIYLKGQDIGDLSAPALRRLRSRMQMVFQDPFSSLNPRLRIGYQLMEPLLVHRICGKHEATEQIASLLVRVGLSPHHANTLPHQLSGGQRQRIAIARALAANPDLIVADEAVSALDVSIRAQILNLLDDIRQGSKLSMIFISHDLGVVRHIADRVAVMFLGRFVEIGPVREVFSYPQHPYTRELLDAMPVPEPGRPRRAVRAPPRGEQIRGCSFAPRCPLAIDECRAIRPELVATSEAHASACLRATDVPAFSIDGVDAENPTRQRLRRLQDRFLAGPSGNVAA
jgi:oligopeptide/dipeptide ABC transporter ATP-binding protein